MKNLNRLLICFLSCALILPLHAKNSSPQRTPQETILPSEHVEIPFRLIKKRPYIRASIQGSETMWFLLDTGATTNIVREWVVRRKKLPTRPSNSKVYGFAGVSKTSEICRIKELKLGEAEFQNFDADVQPDESDIWEQIGDKKIAGVIGFRFFADCLLSIDYTTKKIILSKDSLANAKTDWNVIPFFKTSSFSNMDTLPIVPIQIHDQAYPALIDSGFISTITLPEPLLHQFAPDQPISEIPQMYIYGSGGKSQVMRYVRIPYHLKLGAFGINQPPAMVAEPLGALKAGFLILGGELLQHFKITFDQKNRLVQINRQIEISSNVIDYADVTLRIRHLSLEFGESFWRVPGNITVQGETLQKDDQIFLINHRPAFEMNQQEWKKLASSQDAVDLSIMRGEKLIEIRFPLVFLPATREK